MDSWQEIGEAEEGDATKVQKIQDSFAENLAKVEDLVEDMVKYDIKYIFDKSTLHSDYVCQKKLNHVWNHDCVMVPHMVKFLLTNIVACLH